MTFSAADRLPDPGPCTPMAHHWKRGRSICNCGDVSRNGERFGWRVASRLTDQQIRARLAGEL